MGDTVKCSLQLGASPARCRLNWRRVLPDLWCLLACPSGNQIWRMTVTPFAAATATEASLATFGFVWQQMSALWHHDTTAQCSLCLTEWHSYGMQQKMRPYPQPAARGTEVCGDSRQLGQQHHHYITLPRQIRESERKRARARECHICLAELEQMCARGLPLTSRLPARQPLHAGVAPLTWPALPPPICSYYARSRIITVRNYHSPLANSELAQLAPFAVRR